MAASKQEQSPKASSFPVEPGSKLARIQFVSKVHFVGSALGVRGGVNMADEADRINVTRCEIYPFGAFVVLKNGERHVIPGTNVADFMLAPEGE